MHRKTWRLVRKKEKCGQKLAREKRGREPLQLICVSPLGNIKRIPRLSPERNQRSQQLGRRATIQTSKKYSTDGSMEMRGREVKKVNEILPKVSVCKSEATLQFPCMSSSFTTWRWKKWERRGGAFLRSRAPTPTPACPLRFSTGGQLKQAHLTSCLQLAS